MFNTQGKDPDLAPPTTRHMVYLKAGKKLYTDHFCQFAQDPRVAKKKVKPAKEADGPRGGYRIAIRAGYRNKRVFVDNEVPCGQGTETGTFLVGTTMPGDACRGQGPKSFWRIRSVYLRVAGYFSVIFVDACLVYMRLIVYIPSAISRLFVDVEGTLRRLLYLYRRRWISRIVLLPDHLQFGIFFVLSI